MRALKELDGEKMFKSWGTQTEKEDTSGSKYFIPHWTQVGVDCRNLPSPTAYVTFFKTMVLKQRNKSVTAAAAPFHR